MPGVSDAGTGRRTSRDEHVEAHLAPHVSRLCGLATGPRAPRTAGVLERLMAGLDEALSSLLVRGPHRRLRRHGTARGLRGAQGNRRARNHSTSKRHGWIGKKHLHRSQNGRGRHRPASRDCVSLVRLAARAPLRAMSAPRHPADERPRGSAAAPGALSLRRDCE